MVTARTAVRPQAGAHARAAPPHPGWVLAALLGAMFLGSVDIAVANIAGPAIRAGLHASGGELELVVSGYTLAYATLLVTCARLGEARGYRPMFLAGLAAFIAASLACGVAPNASSLVAARVVAGGAAALMTAQVLTGIQLGYEGRARARALGLYSLVLSAGAVAGQSLGGLLISADVLGTTWRPAFLVNVPVGIAVLWLAWRYLPAGARQPQPLDLAGVAAIGAAMVLLVLPLVLGQDAGWPPWTWVCLAASGFAFTALWLVERWVSRRGGRPLVNLRLIARPAIGWALAAQAIATATYFAVLFTLALYLQQGLGKSPAYSGLALVGGRVRDPGPSAGQGSRTAAVAGRSHRAGDPGRRVRRARGLPADGRHQRDAADDPARRRRPGPGHRLHRRAQPPDRLGERRACRRHQRPVQHDHQGRRCDRHRRVRLGVPRTRQRSRPGTGDTRLRRGQPGPGGHRTRCGGAGRDRHTFPLIHRVNGAISALAGYWASGTGDANVQRFIEHDR